MCIIIVLSYKLQSQSGFTNNSAASKSFGKGTMIVNLITFIFLLFYSENNFCQSQNYSREALQKIYPGFGDKWIPFEQDNGVISVGYFENPLGNGRFSLFPEPADVVVFTLYNRRQLKGLVTNSTADLKDFDKNKPIKFVTHGWLSSGKSNTCIKIKDGFLKKYDANVFVMDWSEISGNVIYPIPMKATTGVAEYYAKFLNNLVDFGVDPKNIHLVGHSLGAHVSGFASRKIKKGKVGRISGLDPALPGFDVGLVDGGHLTQNDADFVDVIHTCGGFLGMKTSLGHADFYPNGGSAPQPGCGNIFEMIEACSHGRSWLFFSESLTSTTPFMAYPCDSFENFANKNRCKEKGIAMGDPVPLTAKGNYYLYTDAEYPFVIKEF